MGLSPFSPEVPRPLDSPFVPHTLMPNHGSTVPLLKFQIAPRIRLLKYSGSKNKEPRYYCLSKSPVKEGSLHSSHQGPYGEIRPLPEAYLTYPSVSPGKKPPSRFPSQCSHRERRSFSRSILLPSLKVPGKEASLQVPLAVLP